MRIAVFGLGYVGAVSAGCFADLGHDVWGVDVDQRKIDAVNHGRAPFYEPGLDELLGRVRDEHRLRAVVNAEIAVDATELALVCVGTPSAPNGKVNVAHLVRVSEEIGTAVRAADKPYAVVYRSTVFPTALEDQVIPALKETSGPGWARTSVGVNPEFLREGSAIKDFFDPPYIIVGTQAPTLAAQMRTLYQGLKAPVFTTELRTASLVKYANNAFHALKVAFANEMGGLARSLDVDGYELMHIFAQDDKLNLSAHYLKPGFAFGGSCLPKDLRALIYEARRHDLDPCLALAALEGNERLIRHTSERILSNGKRRVGVLGLAHKANTDDVRESPVVALVELLIGKGCDVRIFDAHLSLDTIYGSNRAFLEASLPHIARLMASSAEDVVRHAEILVLTQSLGPFNLSLSDVLRDGRLVLDFARNAKHKTDRALGYEGIAW